MSYLDDVARKRQEAAQKEQREAELRQSLDTAKMSSNMVASEVASQGKQARSTTQKVEVTNDLAKKDDIDAVIAQLKEVQLASLLGGQSKPSVILSDSTDLGEKVATLGVDLKNILEAIKSDNKNELSNTLTSQYKQLADSIKSAIASQAKEISRSMEGVNATLQSKDFNPNIKVDIPEQPEVNLDLSSVEASLKSLEGAIKANKVVMPKTDYSKLEAAVSRVESAINGLQFPVPNYVLPYRDINGKATQVTLDSNGKIPVATTATVDTTGLATDSNQTDGSQKTQIVDAGGEAVTVTGGKLDVNATASLAGTALPISGATEAVGVAIVDGSGNQVTSFGGGTQYTEDAAAAANPVGTALNMVRDDARSGSLTTADGDNVAARGTNAGELYVKHVDSIPVTDNGSSLTIDASSLPLPTGASTAANQTTANTSLSTIAGAISGTEMQVDIVAALPAGTNNIGDVDVLTFPSTVHSADFDTGAGTDTTLAFGLTVPASGGAAVVPGDATAGLKVDLGADNDVTVSSSALPSGAATSAKQDAGNTSLSTIAGAVSGTEMQVDVLTMPTTTVQATNLDIRDLTSASDNVAVVGTVADDSTTPGSPVMIGGSAVETDNTDPTSVSAEDDVARVRTDRNRRLLVNTRHPRGFSANENHSSAQTNNELQAAPGASLSLYITDLIISNGATAGSVQIVTDTTGTPATVLGPYYFAINGGLVKHFETPVRVTANTNLGFTSTTVTTHTLSVQGYIAP